MGERFRIRFNYQGNVITDVGNNVLYVGERSSWYPNLGLGSPVSFDLKFDYPDSLTLVATGERVEQEDCGRSDSQSMALGRRVSSGRLQSGTLPLGQPPRRKDDG